MAIYGAEAGVTGLRSPKLLSMLTPLTLSIQERDHLERSDYMIFRGPRTSVVVRTEAQDTDGRKQLP